MPYKRCQVRWIPSPRDAPVVSEWGDRQDAADRLDLIGIAVIVDKRDYGRNERSLPKRFRRRVASLEGRRMRSSSALFAIETPVAHLDGAIPLVIDHRTARSRTWDANLFVVFLVMATPSQELEPPTDPGRFNQNAHKLVLKRISM